MGKFRVKSPCVSFDTAILDTLNWENNTSSVPYYWFRHLGRIPVAICWMILFVSYPIIWFRYWYYSMKKKMRMIESQFLALFGSSPLNQKLKTQWFPLGVLIIGQKSFQFRILHLKTPHPVLLYWLFNGESLVVLVTIKMNGIGTQIFLLSTVCNLTSSLLLFQINNEAL